MEELGFAPADLAVASAVLVSGVLAYSRGFAREALSLLCWIAAAWTAVRLLDWAGTALAPYVPDPLIASFLGAGAIFLAVLVATSLVAGHVAARAGGGFFAPLDHSLGFLFGALRGLAIVAVLYALLSSTLWAGHCPSWVRGARTLPLVNFTVHVLWALVPDGLPPATTACRVPTFNGVAAPTRGGNRSRAPKQAGGASPKEEGQGYAPAEREALDRLFNIEGGEAEE